MAGSISENGKKENSMVKEPISKEIRKRKAFGKQESALSGSRMAREIRTWTILTSEFRLLFLVSNKLFQKFKI